MKKEYVIKQATIVNDNQQFVADVHIKNGRINKISNHIDSFSNVVEINAEGKYLIPGAIDDQVHFREPGLTHKANIFTESRAAVAGGVTTFFEMPNTNPPATTIELLEEKYNIAQKTSLANYSFFMGTTNDNYEELMKVNPQNICGIKIFMGSSTGNMLVDDDHILSKIFANSPTIIATHCEDETTVRNNLKIFKEKYGDNISAQYHPEIRSEEACYLSSSKAVELAKKYQTRLHILHISTAKELSLFSNDLPLEKKLITSEACIHHIWFYDNDYKSKGNFIKWNPAVKKETDRLAIIEAINSNIIDVIATDHAPHTLDEKSQNYWNAPSGGPLVQHSIVAMMNLVDKGTFTIEKMVEKMSHHPAILFRVKERGYIREGYFADLVLLEKGEWQINKENLLYKCKWSPFEGEVMKYRISKTFINGHLAYDNGKLNEEVLGERVEFGG